MAKSVWLLAIGGALMASTALAQPPEGERGRRRERDPERMKQLIERFDEDGDGELSREERQKARETMRSERGERGGRPGGPGGEAGERGRGGPGGPGGPGGRRGMAQPGDLFDQIDSDGDGTITKEQFVAFMEQMRERMGQRGGPGGERGGRGRGGERGQRGPRDRPPVEEADDEL